jgi:hypothetical protein
LLGLDLALSKRSPLWYVIAAISISAVALSNWLGAFALTIAIFAYLLAQSATGDVWKPWLTTLGLGALAYALVCYWIPPSTIRDISYNARTVGGDFGQTYTMLPLFLTAGLLAAVLLKYAMHRFKVSAPLQFSLLFALLMGAIPLAAEWFKIALVPQPERYHLEFDLALCLAAVLAFRAFDRRIPGRFKAPLAGALMVLSIFPARLDRRFARRVVKPVTISETVEYQTAKWFDGHVQAGRVLAPGTISFWMNAFSDTPQLGGGFDQGIVNRTHDMVAYQIFSGQGAGDHTGEIATRWLRAYGVQAVAVGAAHSREIYKPFRRPDVFASSFPLALRDGDDAIYWVPGRDGTLAHIMAPESLVRDRPANGGDIAETRGYVEALTKPASFRWTSRHSAVIEAALRPEDVVSVQITYHPGWRALANGKPCRVSSDGLGQIVVEPACSGECKLDLVYDGGLEMGAATIVSGASWLGCLVWILFSRRKRL